MFTPENCTDCIYCNKIEGVIPVSICENPIQFAKHHNKKVMTSVSIFTCDESLKININWKENESK